MIDADGNVVCDKCKKYLQQGDWPFCPHPSNVTYNAVGDECDVWIRHGICNDDGTPKHYTSKQEIKRAAEKAGLINMVRHVGERGTDKAKHTTRWY